MLSKLVKIPLLRRVVPSLVLRILKIFKKNRGYFKIGKTKMFLDFLDPIDKKIILNQEYEKLEINYLLDKIKKNKILNFIDVGANCGYYSIYIANNVPDIIIQSFEPNKEAFFKLKKTLEINPALNDKINIYNFGLSNEAGKLKMQSMIKHGYSQTGGSTIIGNNSFKNFDVYYADFKIGDKVINQNQNKIAIKIDVEGHEINVLNGLKNTLMKNKIIIQIEIFEINFQKVNNFLMSMGYRLIFKIKKRSNYFYSNI